MSSKALRDSLQVAESYIYEMNRVLLPLGHEQRIPEERNIYKCSCKCKKMLLLIILISDAIPILQ